MQENMKKNIYIYGEGGAKTQQEGNAGEWAINPTSFAFRVRGGNQRFLRAPAVRVGYFLGWGDSGEQRSAGCAEHPSAPGVASGDSRAASATSPPLTASPGRPRQPPPPRCRLGDGGG